MKGEARSAETRARISRGVRWAAKARAERARIAREAAERAAEVTPVAIETFKASGTVAECLEPFVDGIGYEIATLIDALGGEDRTTPQQRALIDDYAKLGLVLNAELFRYCQSFSKDGAAKIVPLVNARRASLQLLGLSRVAKDIEPLDDYVMALSEQRVAPATDAPEEA